RIITSVAQDCCPKNAMLKITIAISTGVRVTKYAIGISAALAPSAILRANSTECPARISRLENHPPHNDPAPDAAYGIHANAPTWLVLNPRASYRYFGSQKA